MGDKIASKKAAAAAKVSTVPGHLGVIENYAEAVKVAEQIGYPVMIKGVRAVAAKARGSPTAKRKSQKVLPVRAQKQNHRFGDDGVFSSRNSSPIRAI